MATRTPPAQGGSAGGRSGRKAIVINDVTALPLRPAAPMPGAPIAPPVLRPIAPGKERWPVKTGTDDDVGEVGRDDAGNGVRVQSSVRELVQMQRPRDMLPVDELFPAYQSARAQPVETTIFTIDGEIIACKLEDDGDFHIVVQGDTGETMIVEVPDPDARFVDPSSPWVDAIKSARSEIANQLSPERELKKVRRAARITGVGFFDRVHGQAGVASTNGIELHPVLGVEWL